MLYDYQQNILTTGRLKGLKGPLKSLLCHYPPDVICIINGQALTKSDILDAKRTRQARELKNKLRSYDNIIKPCFVWTFNNGPIIPYGGWWLYVRTLRHSWWVSRLYNSKEITFKIRTLFPCGMLPIRQNYQSWMREFARCYPRVTEKQPLDQGQGMVLARAVYEPGYRLIDIKEL